MARKGKAEQRKRRRAKATATTVSTTVAEANRLFQARQLPQAVEACKRVLQAQPNNHQALHLLGVISLNMGSIPPAIQLLVRAVSIKPDYAEAHNNLGNAFWMIGQREQAFKALSKAVELKPDQPKFQCDLGNILRDAGQYDSAVDAYRRACELDASFAQAWGMLGVTLQEAGKTQEAIEACQKAVELAPNIAQTHYCLGHVLLVADRHAQAVEVLKHAETLGPTQDMNQTDLGRAYMHLGQFDEAERVFRDLIRHNPRNAGAHYYLAEIMGKRLGDQELSAMEALLEETASTSDADRMLLHAAIGRVSDAKEDYPQAHRHIQQAHELEKRVYESLGQAYSPEAFETFVDRMIEVCDEQFFQKIQGLGSSTNRPVFVLGMPRSGTTLIERILASHPQIYGAGELLYLKQEFDSLVADSDCLKDPLKALSMLSPERLKQLADSYLDQIAPLAGEADRVVDKMPENYLLIGLIAAAFPNATIIHIQRDVRDVAMSCWLTHFESMRWACDEDWIVHRIGQHQRIMKHWRTVLPGRILDISYEQLVEDFESHARTLINSLSLPWSDECLDFHRQKAVVKTASVQQVRQAVHRKSVGRWQNYRELLCSMFQKLESFV